MTSAAESANAAMAEYWAGPGGQRWLAHAPLLERQLAEIGDALLGAAAMRPGERVLEIGCGTAMLATRILAAVSPGGALLGVDIAEPLLALARAAATEATFLRADAQADPLPGGQDLALSRFGVMFFDDPVAAFANIRGSLRAGGRLCFVCWGPLADSPFWSVPLAAAVARLGAPEPQAPEAPGPLAFADAGRVRGILGAAGFAQVGIDTRMIPSRQRTLGDAVTLAMAIGPSGALVTVREPDDATRAMVRADMAHAMAGFVRADGFAAPACVHVVTAINPG